MSDILLKGRSDISYKLFRKVRSEYRNSIKEFKIKYIKNTIECCSINSRKFYSLINNLTGRKNNITLPNIPDDEIFSTFINHFRDKITMICDTIKIAKSNISINLDPFAPDFIPDSNFARNYSFSDFYMVSDSEIYDLIMSSSSTSPNDILPLSLIKKLSYTLVPHYCSIVNFSLYTSNFPTIFKHALVTPLLKKSNLDCSNLSNYRPISKLPMLSKIIEKVVSKQIREYLMINDLYDDFQNAYRPGHSTETTLIKLTNDIIGYLDDSEHAQLLLLDLSAAFDSLDHNILISRLRSIGFNGAALNWLISYLSNRTYSIYIKGIYSPNESLIYGVPQGSVLGPLLFMIYILPLSKVIKQFTNINYVIYSDDIQLYWKVPTSSNNVPNELTLCAQNVRKWLILNNLFPNSSKTKLLNISLKPFIFPTITFDSTVIIPSDCAKSLGVILDSKLGFTQFATSQCRSANFNLFNIRKIRKYLSTESTIALVQSLVLSRLQYCNSLLINSKLKLFYGLNRVIKSSTRLIFNIKRCDQISITKKLGDLNWFLMDNMCKFKILSITHKTIILKKPIYLNKLLNEELMRNTRLQYSNLLSVPKINLMRIGKISFGWAAPSMWNSLPKSLRCTRSHTEFKKKLRILLLTI